MAEGEVTIEPPNVVCSGKVRISCNMDAIWTLLLDTVEHPTLYDSNIARARCLEREASQKRVVRRVTSLVAPMQVIQHSIELTPPPKEPTEAELAELEKKKEEEKVMEESLRKIFDKMDVNGNGAVEMKEVLALLQNDEEIKAMIAEAPALEKLLTQESWQEAFKAMDSAKVFQGRKDGVVNWPEFRGTFIPEEQIKCAITWNVERMGPVENEMTDCPGTITYTVRLVDEGICEFVMAAKIRVPEPTPDLKPWVKKTAASFKGLVEKITYLCPRLVQEWELYSQVLHHKILRKAKGFNFMNAELARSPSALGFYQRSPTPGIRDGFSPYPAMQRQFAHEEGRPHSSLL